MGDKMTKHDRAVLDLSRWLAELMRYAYPQVSPRSTQQNCEDVAHALLGMMDSAYWLETTGQIGAIEFDVRVRA